MNYDVPRKANRVLNLFIFALVLILIRLWYLTIIQHDYYLEVARRPQRKTLIEKASRGTIRDRFDIPLAVNQIQYNVAIIYDQIREIPTSRISRDENGKKIRIYPRRRYIEEFSKFLGTELGIDSQDIEDLIHGRAALFPHTPFVIQEEIPEKSYAKLRMLEREWSGLHMQRTSIRTYPHGKLACDVIGYLGSINQREFLSVASEINTLKTYLAVRERGEPVFLPIGFNSVLEVQERLNELQKKAYTIHDFVGKAGIEAKFDKELRGNYGRKSYEVSVKGERIRELPGSLPAIPGKRFTLALSYEMQDLAEKLLAESEKVRDDNFRYAGKSHSKLPAPWIKGGAIVAIVPTTGEVVAMASYPRYDPNDFITQDNAAILKWLESPSYIADLWDGTRMLEREFYTEKKGYYSEVIPLSFEKYLDMVLSRQSEVKQTIFEMNTLSSGLELLSQMHMLLELSEQHDFPSLIDTLYLETPSSFNTQDFQKTQIQEALNQNPECACELKKQIHIVFQKITHNDDKLLLLDLLRLLIDEKKFTPELKEAYGHISLSSFHELTQMASRLQYENKKMAKEHFLNTDFKRWREKHFQDYLEEKRLEEKEKKTYEHPYTEYLAEAKRELFSEYWQILRWEIFETFLDDQYLDKLPLLKITRPFKELTRPLIGYYPILRKKRGKALEKDLAAAFYPKEGFGYGRSYAYRQATQLGSLFKVVTGYEALVQKYRKDGGYDLNPLTLTDESSPTKRNKIIGYTESGEPIHRRHRGGTLPRSFRRMGKLDFYKAFEDSSNVYFSYLASECIEKPLDLLNASKQFSFGKKTGIDLPWEMNGNLPNDLYDNRTGFYAFAIGQHTLITSPLQTSIMLASIANGGEVLKPQILGHIEGEKYHQEDTFSKSTFTFQEDLNRLGIHFPLFTEAVEGQKTPLLKSCGKEVVRTIFLPPQVRHVLLEGMRRVVWGDHGHAHPSRIRNLYGKRQEIRDYLSLRNQMIGKTSTAERVYRPCLDRQFPSMLCKDIWFGSVAFNKSSMEPLKPLTLWSDPELVVVVYLRYGNYGKEAAPIAAKMIRKWQTIQTH